ncbi:MAG: hypothetical protein IJ547_06965 [Clostridia bacterium]|nr:hypothetical protein [Clostridia bacterium]MBQ8470310.1 hypothetical protein [Clostridia bacterium]
MKRYYAEQPDGYRETIELGVGKVRYFDLNRSEGKGTPAQQLARLKEELKTADAVVIGAGAGLSTAAGFTYSGPRFYEYFSDFSMKYGFSDMYSGGFYPYEDAETRWAFWARNIYVNRVLNAPKPVYEDLLELVKEKDYFVITTNVDHCFQKAGFDKKRLFYTQGDYGLFQSVDPFERETYDNLDWVLSAMDAQGFVLNEDGIYVMPEEGVSTRIPSELIPKSPKTGADVVMNLRADDAFLEDEGWHAASAAYADFLRRHDRLHVLYLELGVGANTPVIIKYPFWALTERNPKAVYACINFGAAFCPRQIESQSICLDADIAEVLAQLK